MEGEREETIGNRRGLHSLLDPLLKYHIFFKSLSLDLLALPVFTSETRNYRSKSYGRGRKRTMASAIRR